MWNLIKTKTFWGSVATIATGAGFVAVGNYPEGINLIVGGLLAIFLRDGILKGAILK